MIKIITEKHGSFGSDSNNLDIFFGRKTNVCDDKSPEDHKVEILIFAKIE